MTMTSGGKRKPANANANASASAEREQGLGGGFSCQQSHGSDTVTANATVPPPFCLVVDGVDFHI